MSKYAKMDGLVEMVVELRDAGTPWDKEGGIVTQVRERFPGYTTTSAIPLRRLYNAHKLQEAGTVKATKARVIAMRKAGRGWTFIADATGSSVAAVKKLVADTEWAEGRVYLDGAGGYSIVDLAAVKAAKAEAEDTEVEGDTPEAA